MSQLNKRVVVVLCPNGRRVTVKAVASTSIGQIIEEACSKHSYEPLNYNLRHLKRVLDSSSSLQYSNIPNHAQLELVEATVPRQEGSVTVNLVTENGQRLIADFPSSLTLWDILIHHDNKEESFSLPSPESGALPFIVYTMKKVVGEELKTTTLKSLGLYNGRCMMRYNIQECPNGANSSTSSLNVIVQPKLKLSQEYNKDNASVIDSKPKTMNGSSETVQMDYTPTHDDSENTLPQKCEYASVSTNVCAFESPEIKNSEPCDQSSTTEAMDTREPIHRNQDLKLCDKTLNGAQSPKEDQNSHFNKETSDEVNPIKEASERSENSSSEKENESSAEKMPTFIPLSDHESILFSLDDAPPPSQSQENDDFFELSIDEIRRLYHEQVRNLKELEDAPLMTNELRQLEKDSRLLNAMNRHPVTQLRICFPDRHVIQANFKPRNTVGEVMAFLRPLLFKNDLNFYLYTTFPRTVLKPSDGLVEAGCIPKARLYLGTEEDVPQFLSEESLRKKSSFAAAAKAVVRSKKSRTLDDPPLPTKSSENTLVQRAQQTTTPDASTSNVNIPRTSQKPKWFKLSNK